MSSLAQPSDYKKSNIDKYNSDHCKNYINDLHCT